MDHVHSSGDGRAIVAQLAPGQRLTRPGNNFRRTGNLCPVAFSPALPPEGQVALTLGELCGLTTEEIAGAFLVTPATLAQAHRTREGRHPR